MRIASLVPSATEMLFALGLGGDVVAVTHECDYPPAARELPHLTATVLPEGLDAGQIDAAVKEIVAAGKALYSLDEERLAELAPDLIVTQAVCDVCAVSYDDVVEVAARLPSRPQVLQQDPSTLARCSRTSPGWVRPPGSRSAPPGAQPSWRRGWRRCARRSPARRARGSSRSSGSTLPSSAATGSRR